MLSKNEIIKEIKNEDPIIRNAIYNYVSKKHLYEDKDINEAFIEFIKNNYKELDYMSLRYSKLNKEIIETLIEINLKEKEEYIKSSINNVLVNHYSIIKELDYDFEEMMKNNNSQNTADKENELLYKKIKHFTKKDPEQILDLYVKNVEQYYLNNEETDNIRIMRKALGIALIQTVDGHFQLLKYITSIMDWAVECQENYQEFIGTHMPYLMKLLCQCGEQGFTRLILQTYLSGIDSDEDRYEAYNYFSNISESKYADIFIDILNQFDKEEVEDWYYDIAEYLQFTKIEKFLLKELKNTKNREIKENIICILARNFNKEVIPYALDFYKKGDYETDVYIKEALYPLLVLENKQDEISRKLIDEVRNDEIFYTEQYEEKKKFIATILSNAQKEKLKDKPHIKIYENIRKLHDEITRDMIKYLEDGKFELKINYPEKNHQKGAEEVSYIKAQFDTKEEIGVRGIHNLTIYKNAENMNCITEEFVKNKRYEEKEKNEMLECMLNSEAGLFEVLNADILEGKVYLRDVLTDKTYCIIDIALSSSMDADKIYIYTRIVTYNGISFGTGFVIPFRKKDKFICEWIQKNKSEYNRKQEVTRMLELYREYDKNFKRVIMTTRSF